MDPSEGTLYGRLSTDLTSEFTHFNPGIRLRKGKQSAFFSTFHVVYRHVELLAAATGHSFFVVVAIRTAEKLSFFLEAQAFADIQKQHARHQACPFPAGMVLLVFSVR